MVAKASRCYECRARKIKCDQTWPTCGPCNRSGRNCPGPPKRRFLSYDASSLGKPPPSSPTTLLATNLVKRIQSDKAKHNPSYLGAFIPSLPSRLETSPALAATILCCLDACNKKHLNLPASVDAHLYGSALKEVQLSLSSPSSSTLLAVILLQKLSTLLSTHRLAKIPCWSVHAGGISQLLQYHHTPPDAEDEVVYNAVLENIGPIISHAVFKDEECFLTRAEWQVLFLGRKVRSRVEGMANVVYAQLAFLPGLINGFHALGRGRDPGVFEKTKGIGLQISRKLCIVGQELDQFVFPGLETEESDSPVGRVFSISDLDLARLICWHADLSILTNSVLAQLSALEGDHEVVESLRQQNVLMSQRIWMLSREAQQAGILRYYFYPGALTVTWESAESDDARRWIVDLLNEMQGCRSDSADAWTAESVQEASDALTGKG